MSFIRSVPSHRKEGTLTKDKKDTENVSIHVYCLTWLVIWGPCKVLSTAPSTGLHAVLQDACAGQTFSITVDREKWKLWIALLKLKKLLHCTVLNTKMNSENATPQVFHLCHHGDQFDLITAFSRFKINLFLLFLKKKKTFMQLVQEQILDISLHCNCLTALVIASQITYF